MLGYVGFLAIASLAEAHLYAEHFHVHCYKGHGGTPLDDKDTPIKNVTEEKCKSACDSNPKCAAFARLYSWHSEYGDCYLRSAINLTECDSSQWSSWYTAEQVEPPALNGNIMYHLFEPKYTGLGNKDGANFKGDASFIFETFSKFSKGNPEASLEHNIIEMSEVNVTGWGTYEQCNAPGAVGHFTCPENQTDYCCTTHDPTNRSHNIPSNHTRTQLPGIEVALGSLGSQFGAPGWWFSFPKESQNVTWTEKVLRRVAGKCLGDAWRKDAGGCTECGSDLDQCVAKCIQGALVPQGNITLLEATWDRVFADPKECPDVPFPSDFVIVV